MRCHGNEKIVRLAVTFLFDGRAYPGRRGPARVPRRWQSLPRECTGGGGWRPGRVNPLAVASLWVGYKVLYTLSEPVGDSFFFLKWRRISKSLSARPSFVARYYQAKLLGQSLSYTIDLSEVGCSCNAALYLVSMPGFNRSNPLPDPRGGDYYCGANAGKVSQANALSVAPGAWPRRSPHDLGMHWIRNAPWR